MPVLSSEYSPCKILVGNGPRRQQMCLAIPGKVVEVFKHEGLQMARVQFGGVTRDACLDYVPETRVGEYVLVHVGFAISRVDEEEARRTYEALAELDQLGELDIPEVDARSGGAI
jgi:hydrogenase expression/formation protein HypC